MRVILIVSTMLLGALVGSTLLAQTPTPAQGRDYTNGINRIVAVDSAGQLIINTSGGSGCPGTLVTPCVVGGSASAGAAIAGKPVPGGVRDEVGNIQFMGSIAGATPGDNGRRSLAVGPVLYNGATFDPSFACTLSAPIAVSSSGNTEILSLTGSATIRICHISWSVSTGAAVAIKLTTGTGTNCAGATADLTGVYTSPAVALDFGPAAALRGPVSSAICANLGTGVAVGGTVVYAKF